MLIKMENDIESPPPRRVGNLCELRSFGISISEYRNEYCLINPVISIEKTNILNRKRMIPNVVISDYFLVQF